MRVFAPSVSMDTLPRINSTTDLNAAANANSSLNGEDDYSERNTGNNATNGSASTNSTVLVDRDRPTIRTYILNMLLGTSNHSLFVSLLLLIDFSFFRYPCE